jgi:hypothetical protein
MAAVIPLEKPPLMKTAIWIIALVGLLPLTLIAILNLVSTISMRRQLAAEPLDDGSTSIVTSTIQFNDSMAPMSISSHPWPSLVILAGVVFCLVGLYFLIPTQPTRVARDGYSKFEPMIKRVVGSNKEYSSLIVSAQNGNKAILIMKQNGQIALSVSTDTEDTKTSNALKSYFETRNITPTEEYQTHDENFGTNTTHFEFSLRGNTADIAKICRDVFNGVFGVENNEPMEFNVEY